MSNETSSRSMSTGNWITVGSAALLIIAFASLAGVKLVKLFLQNEMDTYQHPVVEEQLNQSPIGRMLADAGIVEVNATLSDVFSDNSISCTHLELTVSRAGYDKNGKSHADGVKRVHVLTNKWPISDSGCAETISIVNYQILDPGFALKIDRDFAKSGEIVDPVKMAELVNFLSEISLDVIGQGHVRDRDIEQKVSEVFGGSVNHDTSDADMDEFLNNLWESMEQDMDLIFTQRNNEQG